MHERSPTIDPPHGPRSLRPVETWFDAAPTAESTHALVVPERRSEAGAKTGTTRRLDSLGMPDETLLGELRPRAGRIALFSLCVVAVLGFGQWISTSVRDGDFEGSLRLFPGFVLAVVLSTLLWWMAGHSGWSHRTVYCTMVALVLYHCFFSTVVHAVHEFQQIGQVTALGPFVFMIALLPLLLPVPMRHLLLVLAFALLAVAAALWLTRWLGWAELRGAALVDMGIGVGGATLIAVLLARHLSSLRRDVVRARRIGSYHLEEPLGEGGMGEVWRARHHMLARPAAVKLIRPKNLVGGPLSEQAKERFWREAQATAALRSPHTVPLYDFGTTGDGSYYYAMELLDGIDLSALVRTHGAQPAARVVAILRGVCDSLSEAHHLGLVHRDIKPANVMICRQGRVLDVVKVLDFGIVGFLPELSSEDSDLTRPGAMVGTFAYSAPEVLLGDPSDQRSDLYSVGCLAYWLLAGHKVFESGSALQWITQRMRGDADDPSLDGKAPQDLERIVLDCLSLEPDRRPASADDLAARLAASSLADAWTQDEAVRWWRDHGPAPVETGAFALAALSLGDESGQSPPAPYPPRDGSGTVTLP